MIIMSNVVSVVDQIADINAKIKALETKKKELRKILVQGMGPGEYLGTSHRALVYEVSDSITVQWQDVAEHFKNHKIFEKLKNDNSTEKKGFRALKITGL